MKKNMISLLITIVLIMAMSSISVFAESEEASVSSGDGTADNPYTIATLEDLRTLTSMETSPDTYYVLTDDIVYSGGDWTSIYTFDGNLDGRGYTIYDFTGPEPLFGTVNGTVKNLNIIVYKDAVNKSREYDTLRGSIICNYNKGNIENVYIAGPFKPGAEYEGGNIGVFCGSNSGIIDSCISNVNSRDNICGFAKYNEWNGVISNCLNLSPCLNGPSEESGNIYPFANNRGKIESCVDLGTKVLSAAIFRPDGDGNVTNSYMYSPATKNVSGRTGYTALTSEQVFQKSAYKGLDFDSKWTMNPHTGLPVPAANSMAKDLEDTAKLLQAADNVKAEGYTANKIRLSWDPVEGANGYVIYRAGNLMKDGSLYVHTELRGGDINEYIDKVGANSSVMYYYHVAPIFELDGNDYYGTASGWANSTVLDTTSSGDFEDDSIGPTIEDVTVLTDSATKPGAIKVKIKASDEGTGITSIKAGVVQYGEYTYREDEDVPNSYEVIKKYSASKEKNVTISIPIPENAANGNYCIGRITVTDKVGNRTDCIGCLIDGKMIPVSNEFEIEFTGALSNSNALKMLSRIDEGTAVKLTIDEASKGILKKEMLDAIKGKDKTIIVYANKSGSMQWIFYGKDITGKTKDLNLKVSMDKVSGEGYGVSGSLVRLVFADNGQLPGNVNFRLKTDYLNSISGLDDEIYLYYLNGKKMSMESSDCKVLKFASSYWCYAELDHNSTFYLSGKKLKNPMIKQSVKLADTSYVYNGKYRKPEVTVKGLKKGTDYTVSYSKNKYAGTATAIIKGKGKYGGTVKKTFKIVPKSTYITSRKALSKGFLVKWKKQSVQTTGYQICYSTSSKFTSSTTKYLRLANPKTISKKITNLKRGKTYYVKVRTYKKVGEKYYYSSWSKYRKVTTKK